MKKYLLTFVVLAALMLGGCANDASSTTTTTTTSGTTTTTVSQTTADIEQSLPLIRTGASVAAGAVLNFTVKDPTERQTLANEMYAGAAAAYALTSGQLPTVAQFKNAILVYGGSETDANYANFASSLSSLYASYYPQLIKGDTKTAADVINALAGGVEDATTAFITVPTTTTTTAPIVTSTSTNAATTNAAPTSN